MRPAWTHNLPPAKYHKIFLLMAVLPAALYAMGFVIPLEGPWVDFTAEKFLNRQTGLLIRCEKTKIIRWSQASFQTMAVGIGTQKQLLVAGPGSIYFRKSPFTVIDLKDLRLTETFHPANFFSSWPIAKGLEGKFSVTHLRVGFSGGRSGGLIRIFDCESDDFSLRGVLVIKDKYITKAHIYFSLSPSRLKKLPLQIRSRMSGKKEGWAAVHIVFYQNQLTLSGRRGPLFQAKWQGQVG